MILFSKRWFLCTCKNNDLGTTLIVGESGNHTIHGDAVNTKRCIEKLSADDAGSLGPNMFSLKLVFNGEKSVKEDIANTYKNNTFKSKSNIWQQQDDIIMYKK